jgi:hypothetical protein
VSWKNQALLFSGYRENERARVVLDYTEAEERRQTRKLQRSYVCISEREPEALVLLPRFFFLFRQLLDSKSCAICEIYVIGVLCEPLWQVKERHLAGKEVKLSERIDEILSTGDKNGEIAVLVDSAMSRV